MNFSKKIIMMLRDGRLITRIMSGLFGLAFASSPQAAELNIYAGPQSVSPGKVIYVTVQSVDSNAAIELSYISDGKYETRTAMTHHGLASFEIPAQKTTGQMSFVASMEDNLSDRSIVSVLAGPPASFKLSVKRGQKTGTVAVSSAVITDRFDNPVSDLALAALDWIDNTGLIASQNTQLLQGRLQLNMVCPREFHGGLILRATVSTAEYIMPNMSQFCWNTDLSIGEGE